MVGAALLAAVGGAVVVTVVGGGHDPLLVSGHEMLPGETAQDWVTYGDHLVPFTVEDERRGGFARDEPGSPQGTIERYVTIGETTLLWSRDGAPEFVPPAELGWGGWRVDENGDEQEFRYAPSVALEPGDTYIGIMTWIEPPEGEPFWGFLSTWMVLPVSDGVIGAGDDPLLTVQGDYEPRPGDGMHDDLDAIWGRSVDNLTHALQEADPDPRGVPYLDQPVLERYARATA